MNLTRLIGKFLFFLLTFLFCAELTQAQTISGTVTDEQKAPVSKARVSLFSRNIIISETQTDAEGEFSLSGNGGERFTLRVEAEGFAAYEQKFDKNISAPLLIVLLPAALRENVNVSITRTDTRLGETPASIVVLSRETIEQSAAVTVDEQLRQVAGFALFRRSSSRTANPTTLGANLRGIGGSGASRTAVLFDGTSLNDAFGGWTYWTRVPRAAVEQIEVLRGGASSIYGSGGLSGAINILSKRANEPVLRFEASGGTQKTYDGSLFGAIGKNGWNMSLAAEIFGTAGYIPVDERERGAVDARANSRFNSFLPTIEREIGENSRIFVRGNLFSERRDNGTVLQRNRTYFRQAVAGVDFNNAGIGVLNFRSFIEAQVYDQTFSAIAADRNSENLTRLQRVPSQSAGASVSWSRAFDAHTISASLALSEVRGASDETIYTAGRAASLVGAGGRELTFGFFAQDFWRVNEKLNLNFGARFDRWREREALSTTRSLTGNLQTTVVNFPNRTETAFSPRVGAIYQLNERASFVASYSKSFRAPTLNELYRAFRVGNVLTLANENLQAERASTSEIGANLTAFERKFNLRGNLFFAAVLRPVVSLTLSTTPALITRQRQNLGKTRSRGVEIEAEIKPRRDLTFSASYLGVDARVVEFPANPELIGKTLPQIAPHQLSFQAFYRPPQKFSLGMQARALSGQFEDDRNDFRLRPFFTLDAFASFRLTKRIETFIAAENVFDARFDIGRTPVRTISAPRAARIGLRFNFGE